MFDMRNVAGGERAAMAISEFRPAFC